MNPACILHCQRARVGRRHAVRAAPRRLHRTRGVGFARSFTGPIGSSAARSLSPYAGPRNTSRSVKGLLRALI